MHKYKTHVKPRDRGRTRRRPAEHLVAAMLLEVFRDAPGPVTVAVGGPGGTGKSSFAGRLVKLLGDATVLRLDDYKTSRAQRRQANVFGPHPDANKMALIAEHLARVRRGMTFDKPVYDPAAGDAVSTAVFRPARFTIVDGEVSTYREFREHIDFSVFIDSDWHTQLATRLSRDITHRRYTPEKAVATFLHSNLREFSVHGAESKRWADVHLFCHDDYRLEIESVAGELYERARSILHQDLEYLALTGLIVPLLTPFGEDGRVDLRAFAEHLDWLAAAGVRRVLVGGTAGEGCSLTACERVDLLKLALEYFPWLVLFDAGSNSLPEALDLARTAERLGADAVSCAPPQCRANAPADGIAVFLRALSDSVGIPLILSHPREALVPLTPELLASVPHFALGGCEGNPALVKAANGYFSEDDARIARTRRSGALGFISAPANVVPELYLEMETALAGGRSLQAQALQKRINRLLRAVRGPFDIPVLKQLLSRRLNGYPDRVRPPLAPPPPRESDLAGTLRAAMAWQHRPSSI